MYTMKPMNAGRPAHALKSRMIAQFLV